jgi:hypothetical protein
MQGQWLENMWMFNTQHPTVLVVHTAAEVKPILKENIIQYMHSIFHDKDPKPPRVI